MKNTSEADNYMVATMYRLPSRKLNFSWTYTDKILADSCSISVKIQAVGGLQATPGSTKADFFKLNFAELVRWKIVDGTMIASNLKQ